MTYDTYNKSLKLALAASQGPGNEFYSLIMAAMRVADTDNLNYLQAKWPAHYIELMQRYNAPGGKLEGEK